MNCVIYARYSSHAQNDASIEQQVEECKRYADSLDLKVVAIYADRAISGTTDKRPEFQRMIKDSGKKQWDYVIAWKVDRFARNRYDSATYKLKLKNNGVKVLYAKESIPDTPEGILLESILEGSAEYYSANLAQNVKRGHMDNAQKGLINGGVTPLGYQRGTDGRYAINPMEAPIIKEAFELYADGVSTRKIAETFNNKGYRTRYCKPFTKNSLSTVLRNEKYTGVYIYDSVRLEGAIPAIISKELFNAVQDKIQVVRRSPSASRKEKYLLTGKLFCGHCGGTIVGISGTGKLGTTYHYYGCSSRKRGGRCRKENIQKDVLEEAVASVTLKVVLTDSVIDKIAKAAIKLQKDEQDMSNLNALKAQLREVEKSMDNIMTAIEQGMFMPTMKARMTELENRKSQLETEIAQEMCKKPALTYEQLVYWLNHMKMQATTEKIIDTFISKIILFDDRMEIYYRYTDEGGCVNVPYNGESFAFELQSSTIIAKVEHLQLFDGFIVVIIGIKK